MATLVQILAFLLFAVEPAHAQATEPVAAPAAERMLLLQDTKFIDRATGRSREFPGRSGYTYEVVSMAGVHAVVRLRGPTGDPIDGDYILDEKSIPESLKGKIAEGLKAATAGGPKGSKNGCCEVIDEESSEPRAPTRAPAIAPGTGITYANPEPVRRLPVMPPKPAAPIVAQPEPTGRAGGRAVASRSPLCRAFDGFRAKGVPAEPLRQALYFLSKRPNASAQRYVAIADYSQNSRKKRFYLLDLRYGTLDQEKASHGGGMRRRGLRGDPSHDGMLNACGGSGSGMTRAGFFETGRYYNSFGKGRYRWPALTRKPFANGVRLNGLTPGVNDDAQEDGVVMHEQYYNRGGDAVMGRSHGCPAFVPGRGAPLLAKMVRDSSLLYSYAPVCRDQMRKVERQIPGWERFCR